MWSYLYYGQTQAKATGVFSQGDINRWKYHMSGVPFLGDFIRAADSYRYFQDYLNNRDIDWSKVQYPSLNVGAGGYASASANLAFGAGYAYVSKNLMSLYRSGYARNSGYRGPEYM